MKVWQIAGALAVGAAGVSIGLLSRAPALAQSEPHWMADYDAARAVARQTGKPLFVAFR